LRAAPPNPCIPGRCAHWTPSHLGGCAPKPLHPKWLRLPDPPHLGGCAPKPLHPGPSAPCGLRPQTRAFREGVALDPPHQQRAKSLFRSVLKLVGVGSIPLTPPSLSLLHLEESALCERKQIKKLYVKICDNQLKRAWFSVANVYAIPAQGSLMGVRDAPRRCASPSVIIQSAPGVRPCEERAQRALKKTEIVRCKLIAN